MSDADNRTVQADPATIADLLEQAEVLGTKELTTYARSLGVTSPDDRAGWYVVQEYAPDLIHRSLVWVGPDDE
jgi:hypothetical protein